MNTTNITGLLTMSILSGTIVDPRQKSAASLYSAAAAEPGWALSGHGLVSAGSLPGPFVQIPEPVTHTHTHRAETQRKTAAAVTVGRGKLIYVTLQQSNFNQPGFYPSDDTPY